MRSAATNCPSTRCSVATTKTVPTPSHCPLHHLVATHTCGVLHLCWHWLAILSLPLRHPPLRPPLPATAVDASAQSSARSVLCRSRVRELASRRGACCIRLGRAQAGIRRARGSPGHLARCARRSARSHLLRVRLAGLVHVPVSRRERCSTWRHELHNGRQPAACRLLRLRSPPSPPWRRPLEWTAKLFYTQMVDLDTDERYSATVVRSPVPAYEIGVTVRNGGEELITSFYNHTTVRRKGVQPAGEEERGRHAQLRRHRHGARHAQSTAASLATGHGVAGQQEHTAQVSCVGHGDCCGGGV